MSFGAVQIETTTGIEALTSPPPCRRNLGSPTDPGFFKEREETIVRNALGLGCPPGI